MKAITTQNVKGGKPLVIYNKTDHNGGHRHHLYCKVPEAQMLTSHRAFLELPVNQESNCATITLKPDEDATEEDTVRWTGRKDASNTKTVSFLLLDKGTFWLLAPIQGSYVFIPDVENQVGEQDAGELERLQLNTKRAKELALAAVLKTVSQAAREEEEQGEQQSLRKTKKGANEDDELRLVSISAFKKQKLKKILKKRQTEKDLDAEDQVQSSLAVARVRKPDVDWDFDEGSNATDDEEGPPASDPEQVEEEQNVEDSEEEKEVPPLSGYGESLIRMMESQKEREAEAELQQFSDDDDEDSEKPPNVDDSSRGQNGNPLVRNQFPSSRHVPGAGVMNLRTLPADRQHLHHNGLLSNKAEPSDPSASQLASSEQRVKESLMAVLTREPAGVTVKALLNEMGITAKNSRFRIVKDVIRDCCEVSTQTAADGSSVGFVTLKKQ